MVIFKDNLIDNSILQRNLSQKVLLHKIWTFRNRFVNNETLKKQEREMRKQIFFRNTINFCLSQLIIIEKNHCEISPFFFDILDPTRLLFSFWKDKIWYESMIPTNVGWKKKARPKMCFDKSVPLDFPIGMQQECSLLKNNHKVRVYMRENPSWQTVVFILPSNF